MKTLLISLLAVCGLLVSGFSLSPGQGGVAWAQDSSGGRHFVLQGNDALMPIGINNSDTLELADYHGEWSRFSNLGMFVIGPDAHVDYSNARELRNLMVNNTGRFVNNGKITLRGRAVKLGELMGAHGEAAQPLLDMRGGQMLFENTTYEGNGLIALPVVEAEEQSGRMSGENAVGGRLVFEGGVLAAPIYLELLPATRELPFAASEVVVMRGTRLDNALTPDLAVVLHTPRLGSVNLRLQVQELPNEAGYVWKVEPVK